MGEGRNGYLRAVQAVFWSFFGVRKKSDYEQDTQHLTPTQVIVVGVMSAVLFVCMILGVVMWVTS